MASRDVRVRVRPSVVRVRISETAVRTVVRVTAEQPQLLYQYAYHRRKMDLFVCFKCGIRSAASSRLTDLRSSHFSTDFLISHLVNSHIMRPILQVSWEKPSGHHRSKQGEPRSTSTRTTKRSSRAHKRDRRPHRRPRHRRTATADH